MNNDATTVEFSLDLAPVSFETSIHEHFGLHDTESPTAQQVIDNLKDEAGGSKRRAISDWDMLDFDDVTINVVVRAPDGTRTEASW